MFDLLSDKLKQLLHSASETRTLRSKDIGKVVMDKTLDQVGVLGAALHEIGWNEDMGTVGIHSLAIEAGLLLIFNTLDLGESYLKWKLAHICSLCFKQDASELPKRPDFIGNNHNPCIIFGGSCYRFLRQIIHEGNAEAGWTLLMCKKAMPSVSETVISKEVQETFSMLTRDNSDKLPRPLSDDHPSYWDVAAAVVRTTRELFPQGWYEPGQFLVPSIAGHIESARKDGGAFGHLARSRIDHIDFFPDPEAAKSLVFEGPLRTPVLGDAQFTSTINLLQKCGINLPRDILGMIVPYLVQTGPRVSGTQLSRAIAPSIYPRNGIDNDLLPSKLIGLAEPFKVRVISAGPSDHYYVARYRQRAVHTQLRSKAGFELIGQPLSQDYLESRMNNRNYRNTVIYEGLPDEGLLPCTKWNSGDYKAATNLLNPRLTELVAVEIGRRANWRWSVIEDYQKCLTGHLFDYVSNDMEDWLTDHLWYGKPLPAYLTQDGHWDTLDQIARLQLPFFNDEGEWWDSVLQIEEESRSQKWGQLMGSPDSFPILCIINAAVTRLAYETYYGRRFRVSDLPFCVNGDDLGALMNDPIYRLWENLAGQAGLVKSVGKNYFSDSHLVMNSMLFKVSTSNNWFTLFERRYHFEYVPYVNLGLIKGCNGKTNLDKALDVKSGIVASLGDRERLPSLKTLAEDLVEGHSWQKRDALLSRFFKVWTPVLKELVPPGCSWFLPQHLGGLGLPSTRATSSSISFLQRRLATFLSHDPVRQEQLTGVTSLSSNDSFSLWKLQKKLSLPPMIYEYTKDASTSVLGPYVRSDADQREAVVDALRHSGFFDHESSRRTDAYKHWRREWLKIWKIAERTRFPPMDDHNIRVDRPWRKLEFTLAESAESTVDLR